jgi:mRNA interferase YafQ
LGKNWILLIIPIYAKVSKKDIKCDKNFGKLNDNDFNELKLVMKNLIVDVVLGKKYLAYKLMSDWLGYQECHLKPNWLLIHKTSKNQINFARLGTHQQLFKKY